MKSYDGTYRLGVSYGCDNWCDYFNRFDIWGEGLVIHCMADCLGKLKAIKTLAQRGMEGAADQPERAVFEQISMEVSYLLVEASSDANSGDSFLRNYARDHK